MEQNIGTKKICSKKAVQQNGFGLSTATRALVIGVAVIIVCVVCSLALYMSKQGKSAINTGTNQYNKMMEDYQELDRAMYRNLSTYLSLIKSPFNF